MSSSNITNYYPSTPHPAENYQILEMDTRYQTRQQTYKQLHYQIGGLKTDNIDLQIRVEEQRQEIQALKNQLRAAKKKTGLYKEVLELATK